MSAHTTRFKWGKFGQHLRVHRSSRGLGLRECSRSTTIHHATWCRAEQGKKITVPIFLFLCDWMNSNPLQYLTHSSQGHHPMTQTQVTPIEDMSVDELRSISLKLSTYAGVYAGDKEARRMSRRCWEVADLLAAAQSRAPADDELEKAWERQIAEVTSSQVALDICRLAKLNGLFDRAPAEREIVERCAMVADEWANSPSMPANKAAAAEGIAREIRALASPTQPPSKIDDNRQNPTNIDGVT